MLRTNRNGIQNDLTAPPLEEISVRTTLNIQKSNMESLTRIGAFKNITLTTMLNEALKDYCAKMNNVQHIDNVIRETNGFWFERDLAYVLKLLPIEKAKSLLPYQKAYLYCNLKDTSDRNRVFTTLKLGDELRQINAYNEILQKASEFDGENLKGYNIYQLAIDIKAQMTELQYEYLRLKIGHEAILKLEQLNPNVFPKVILPEENETDVTISIAEKQDEDYEENMVSLD